MGNDYKLVQNIRDNIHKLDDKINSIGQDNIINHSSVRDAENIVNKINDDIRKVDNRNRKNKFIKNIKIFGNILKQATPYILVAGLFFGIQALTFDIPFVRQDQLRIAQTEYSTDTLGNHNKELKYVLPSEKQDNDRATYLSKWEKKIDGKYYRAVLNYKFDYKMDSLSLLLNIVDSSKEDKFYNVLSKPKSIDFESKREDEITKEELEQGDYVMTINRYYDDNDVIIMMQDVTPNIIFTLLYLLLTVGTGLGIHLYRKYNDNYSEFFYKIRELESKYEKINIDELKKLFDEGKIKFETVKKQQISLIDPITHETSIVR